MKKFLTVAIVSLCFITADSFAMRVAIDNFATASAINALAIRWNFLPERINAAIKERESTAMFSSTDPRLFARISELSGTYYDEQILQLKNECQIVTPHDLFNFWDATHNMTVSTQNISFEGQMRLYSQWKRNRLPLSSSSAASSSAAPALANPVFHVRVSFTTLADAVKAYAEKVVVDRNKLINIQRAWQAVNEIRCELGNELRVFIDDGHMMMMIESALKQGRSLAQQKPYFIQEWHRAYGRERQHAPYASSPAGSSSASSSAFLPDKLELSVVLTKYGKDNHINFVQSFAEDIRTSLGTRCFGINPNDEELAQLFHEAIRKNCKVEDLMDAFVQKKQQKDAVEEHAFRLATTSADSSSSADFGADQDRGASTADPAQLSARLRKYAVWGSVGVTAVAVTALAAVGVYWYFGKDAKKEKSQNVITS